MATDERTLATWLAELDDGRLAGILVARRVPPAIAWQDFFDAAAALLEAASVDRALTREPRVALVALARGAAPDERIRRHLEDRALLTPDGIPYTVVRERTDAVRSARPDAFVPAPAPPAPPADDVSAAAAAERALATVGALADLLVAAMHAPIGRTGTGAVSAADRRRLTEIGAIGSADQIDDLVAVASEIGLLRDHDREWLVTPRGERWLETSSVRRWTTVVAGLRDALPDALRTDDGGVIPVTAWTAAYPLDAEWPARVERLRRSATAWGLVVSDAEPPWGASWRSGGDLDTDTFARHLPPTIERVYLQADLTAIAPGPLEPVLELRLRRIASRESRAQASSYRFAAETIAAGMTDGETAESIRSFLTGLSLTGIPQPLEYLIDSTAARHGLVRVQAAAGDTGSRIMVADAALREAIAVDQALRALRLRDDGEALISPVSREAVYWALADARYPVVALDAAGGPEPLHRRTVRATPPPTDAAEAYRGVLDTLRSRHTGDADAAWLGREIEQAVRAKATIQVVVRLPDDSERTLTLEATGLGGGRLRGLDRLADVERTLPVSSIVTVRPVG